MAGIEVPTKGMPRVYYECECGEETQYGIFRGTEKDDCTEWHIDSCCGGCVSAVNIRYCPFCGKPISVLKIKGD